MPKLVRFAATAVLGIALGWGAGCSSDKRCFYDSQSYPNGASFPATDGCNVCKCIAAGQVECTLAGCLGDAGFEHPAVAVADARDSAFTATTADVKLPMDTAAPDDAAPVDYCALPTGLTFFAQREFQVPGSIASYEETYHLDNAGLVITRNWWNGYDADFERTCTPMLPLCGPTDQITVWDIGAELADPDVKAALASPPYTLFGTAKWPSDEWSIAADGGGRVFVGLPCPSEDADTCQPIPPSLQRLKDDLQAIATAGAAQPVCVELLQP